MVFEENFLRSILIQMSHLLFNKFREKNFYSLVRRSVFFKTIDVLEENCRQYLELWFVSLRAVRTNLKKSALQSSTVKLVATPCLVFLPKHCSYFSVFRV